MEKTKHNPPRKPKPNFIKFSELQKNYLNEILTRQRGEFNEAVDLVYVELGIKEKILNAPLGTYQLRLDCSGLDIIKVPKKGLGKKEVPDPKT